MLSYYRSCNSDICRVSVSGVSPAHNHYFIMDKNTIIGIVVILLALSVLTYLLLWSKRIIDRIADKQLGSIRDILKDLSDE